PVSWPRLPRSAPAARLQLPLFSAASATLAGALFGDESAAGRSRCEAEGEAAFESFEASASRVELSRPIGSPGGCGRLTAGDDAADWLPYRYVLDGGAGGGLSVHFADPDSSDADPPDTWRLFHRVEFSDEAAAAAAAGSPVELTAGGGTCARRISTWPTTASVSMVEVAAEAAAADATGEGLAVAVVCMWKARLYTWWKARPHNSHLCCLCAEWLNATKANSVLSSRLYSESATKFALPQQRSQVQSLAAATFTNCTPARLHRLAAAPVPAAPVLQLLCCSSVLQLLCLQLLSSNATCRRTAWPSVHGHVPGQVVVSAEHLAADFACEATLLDLSLPGFAAPGASFVCSRDVSVGKRGWLLQLRDAVPPQPAEQAPPAAADAEPADPTAEVLAAATRPSWWQPGPPPAARPRL
uniref:CIA30 domain-containing protein n=1 Tax=Macrostomum lignano TaxID=282301 RepID=A0A1I8F5D7_9PLAT